MADRPGTLYLCPTPIGNLEDMTARTIRVLREAAVIAAEDTRHTRILLRQFAIETPMISYHEHNKQEREPELLQRLRQGETVAVVSDAGMPGISDPGEDLVRQAIGENIPVVALPGPNAALTALVASGLPTGMFTFVGFLPRTVKKRRELLRSLVSLPHTLVFYEAPHRLSAVLKDLLAELGDRRACAAREITKRYEEYVRNTLQGLVEHYAQTAPRGEFCLVVEGASAAAPQDDDKLEPLDAAGLKQKVEALVALGENKKDAIRQVASAEKLAKRVVYQAVHGLMDAAGED